MKFYVIWSDGRKFGPADVPTLIQWAQEGRLNRDTTVENAETGLQGRARDIQGMVWPTNAPATDLGGNDVTLKAGEKPLAQPSSFSISGQPQSYVAGKPLEPQQPVSADPLQPHQPQQQQPSHYDSARQPTQGPGQSSQYQQPPQPGSPYPRSAGYDRHLDDGSAKMITNAWIMYVIGLMCCPITSPFGLYSATRAKNMGNPNANAPVVVGWILVCLQGIAILIYAAVFVVALSSGNGFPGR